MKAHKRKRNTYKYLHEFFERRIATSIPDRGAQNQRDREDAEKMLYVVVVCIKLTDTDK